MNKSMLITMTASLSLAAGMVAGCATNDERPGLAPVPEGLEPRPDLESVAPNAVRAAVAQGGAGFSYDLVKGQRYYLVDETVDRLITSELADRDGELTIGEDGAKFRGRSVWDGTIDANSQIGLYLARQLETP